jgi:hypothetical protein
MHTGKELEAHSVQKGRNSCDSDEPLVGSARSDSTRVVKVNCRKTRPYCIYKCQWLYTIRNTACKVENNGLVFSYFIIEEA